MNDKKVLYLFNIENLFNRFDWIFLFCNMSLFDSKGGFKSPDRIKVLEYE